MNSSTEPSDIPIDPEQPTASAVPTIESYPTLEELSIRSAEDDFHLDPDYRPLPLPPHLQKIAANMMISALLCLFYPTPSPLPTERSTSES